MDDLASPEILALGLCRTGTQSLADALHILGYGKTYHMRNVREEGHTEVWLAFIAAKFEGKETGFMLDRPHFDSFLKGYGVLTDLPVAMFPDELIMAYPKAKVILTTRHPDSWYSSMMSTIWHWWSTQQVGSKLGSGPLINPMLSVADKFNGHLWQSDFPANGLKCFREHNEHVRDRMKERRDDFLEYEVSQGWGPLCDFLQKEVPDQAFPRSDDWVEYKKTVAREAC